MCQQQFQAKVMDQLQQEMENEINISSVSESTETICTSIKDKHEPTLQVNVVLSKNIG